MSESVLNALMQLFAMLAHGVHVSVKGKSIVGDFLGNHTSGSLKDEYLELYLRYYNFFQSEFPSQLKSPRGSNDTLTPFMQRACNQIRRGLTMSDRILVYVMLLEFVRMGAKDTLGKDDLLSIVSESFRIKQDELNDIDHFVLSNSVEAIPASRIINISDKQEATSEDFEGLWVEQNKPKWLSSNRFIYNPSVMGSALFLYLPSARFFIMQYTGSAELYLDGKRVATERVFPFRLGATLSGPNTEPIHFNKLLDLITSDDIKTRIVLTGENLSFLFPSTSIGVHPFSFSVESGQLIGIMGGSGAGKSTLLNLLTGKIKPTRGNATINGFDIHSDIRSLEGIIGYVPQDDLLFEDLTVYQNLYYNAKLCFSNFSEERIRQAVNRILTDLGLSDIGHLTVGSPTNKIISGGQRKRLNIGLELLREPGVLFVDEPTSGLSSADSLMIMKLLKEQAYNGRLVIATIHQPSSKLFLQLDKLWILDKGGYPIYTGNPIESIPYLKSQSGWVNTPQGGCPQCGSINPDQIFEIVEAREVDENGVPTPNRLTTPEEWYSKFIKNSKGSTPKEHKKIIPKNLFNIPNVEVQLQIFLTRNLLSKLSNRQYVLINLLEAPILAFILAFFTKHIQGSEYIFADNQNLPAYIFMSVLVALFMGLIVSAEEIINDKKILERESFLNLSLFSYHTSKLIYLFSLSALQMLLYVLVGNSILGIEGMALYYWLVLFSTACFANMVGLNLSAGLNSVIAIYITIPFILVPQILLSGTVVQFDNLHPSISRRVYVPMVGDLMVSRWAFEALAVTQFKRNNFQKHFYDQEQHVSQANFNSNFLIPRLQSIVEENIRLIESPHGDTHRTDRNLRLIRNELVMLHHRDSIPPFEFFAQLSTPLFTELVAEELFGYLLYLRILYNDKGRDARLALDRAYSSMATSTGGDALQALRRNNHNRAVADWVLNTHEVVKYMETDQRIVPKLNPVYIIPEHNWGRAHMFAPAKRFNQQLVDTLWFNIAVIWMASLLLLVTLQANLLRRLVSLKITSWTTKTA